MRHLIGLAILLSLAACDRKPALPVTNDNAAPPPAAVALPDFTAPVKKTAPTHIPQ
ncbi:MAG: hypothetical protein WC216_07840 [Gallionella sp.]